MKNLYVKILVVTLLVQQSYGVNLTLSGSVVSENQKIMTSRYIGFVKEVFVGEGDMVKKGDLLYTIDSKEIDSTLSQTELSIAQAELSAQMYENQYNNAKLNVERHKRLLAKDMVSKFEVENLELLEQNSKTMLEISKKQILQAKQKRKEVLSSYQYLKIIAPNDSVVIAKNIKAGEMAMPGMASFVLSDLENLKIITEVSESNLKDISIGKDISVEIPSLSLHSKGVIESIIPHLNSQTHMFKVKIKFDKKDMIVYPGMYAVVVISEQER